MLVIAILCCDNTQHTNALNWNEFDLQQFGDGVSGAKIIGSGDDSATGSSVSTIGDFDGDNITDVVIGVYMDTQTTGYQRGISYVLFGNSDLSRTGTIDLLDFQSGASRTRGFRIIGAADTDQSGTAVSGGGDINGDGYDDLIVGAVGANNNLIVNNRVAPGLVYVIFGHDCSVILDDVELATFPSTSDLGFRIMGASSAAYLGNSVSIAGDVNKDGRMDLIVGSPHYSPGGITFAGEAIVLFGASVDNPYPTTIDLLNFEPSASTGFLIFGATTAGNCGGSVRNAGDFNGDGHADLLVACPPDPSSANGLLYVLFTSTTVANVNLSSVTTGAGGFKIYSTAADNQIGAANSFGAAGDVNNDGLDDIIVSDAYANFLGRLSAGITYVLFGRSHLTATFPDMDMKSFAAGAGMGIRIGGHAESVSSGMAVASAGDANRDGYDDIIIGVPYASIYEDRNSNGAVYVVYGRGNQVGFADIDLGTLTSQSHGLLFIGDGTSDATGRVASSAGDFNDDSIGDFVFCAPGASPSMTRNQAGVCYIAYGMPDQPTSQPSTQPTSSPSTPTSQPSAYPTCPTGQPTQQPSTPTSQPSSQPSRQPVGAPSAAPSLNHNDVHLADFVPKVIGMRVYGAAYADNTGASVSPAGDMNHDGIADFMLSSTQANPLIDRVLSGVTYVIFGTRNTSAFADLDLLSFKSGPRGFRVIGGDNWQSGNSIAAIDDINGDHIDDILIGSYQASLPNSNSNDGIAVVVFGRPVTHVWTDIDVVYWQVGIDGFFILPKFQGHYFATSVSGLGDVNGDGVPDIMITEKQTELYALGLELAGAFYVIYGPPTGSNQNIQLASYNGFRIIGASPSGGGWTAAVAGDFNGDGLMDLLVQNVRSVYTPTISSTGSVYVVFGKRNHSHTDVLLSALTPHDGFNISGDPTFNGLGTVQGRAGDVNGDGIGDIIFADYGFNQYGAFRASIVYVLFGHSNHTSFPNIDTRSFPNGTAGFRVFGVNAADQFGAVSSAGDINGDGYDDVLIGCITGGYYGREDAGAVYVVYGHSKSIPFEDIQLSLFARLNQGFAIFGTSWFNSVGRSASAAGDVNGDGMPDMLIGDPGNSALNRDTGGAAFVIFGIPFSPSSTPSSQPSQQPSRQPSAQPSARPSRQPSGQPSRQPTSQPSTRPSVQPSTVPSRQPSSQPSVQPSRQPSSLPSVRPSAQPSTQPSSQPSRQPLSSPTSQPSGHPSCKPTAQPSRLPSAQPSSRPTCQPTTQPSSQPSLRPGAAPTSQPSAQPRGSPSSLPTGSPTAQPSGQSSTQPSGQPSCRPSLHPSAQPTSAPSSRPSSQPSCAPSAQPSRQPTLSPSSRPSSKLTVRASALPSSAPSSQPVSHPTGQPSTQPSRQPSAQPSRQPSSQPSRQPISQPSAHPTIFNASFVDHRLNLLSNVTIVAVTTQRSSLCARIQVTGRVGMNVYCAAFAGYPVTLLSTASVRSRASVVFVRPGVTTLVNITGLVAVSRYSVFCTAMNLQSRELSLSAVQKTQTSVTTQCCRVVTVSLQISRISQSSAIANAVSVTLDALPALPLTICVTFANSSIANLAALTSYPASLVWTNTSTGSLIGTTTVIASGSSLVSQRLTVALSGAGAASYSVVYATSRAISVVAERAVPPVPIVRTARFNGDGSSVVVLFDSATNKGGFSNVFSCRALLSFKGDSTATCQWTDSLTIVIYPAYSATANTYLSVSDSVTVNSAVIKAACTMDSTDCASWSSVLATSVLVLAPLSPALPAISISVPSQLGGCNDLVVDLTNSVGSAGRPWASKPLFVVQTTPSSAAAASQLQFFLNRNYTLNPPTAVPYAAFQKGFTYAITATLCNFLGACGSASRSVVVLASQSSIPVVSVLGQSQRSVYRNTQLVLNSNAYTQSCAGVQSSTNLVYTWSVQVLTAGGLHAPTTIKSVSQSSAVFKLNAYTLAVGAQYQVTLSVQSAAVTGSASSAATVGLLVLQGNVVAKLSGGSARFMQVSSLLSIDASSSTDEDVSTATGVAAGLSFQWSCVQSLPAFSGVCPLVLSTAALTSTALEKLTVSADFTALNTTSVITVVVSGSSGRSSSAQVTVAVTGAPSPVLNIVSVMSLSNINTGKQLALYGTLQLFAPCTAVWSVSDASLRIADISSTPVSALLYPVTGTTVVPFNLVIKPDRLPQRSTLSFSLSCGKTATSVSVTTNGAPLPGALTVSPTFGEELSTLFRFAALQWSDPDLPLTYQFGFESVTSLANLIIVSKSEFSYASSTLPAGVDERQHQINCSLQVFDSFNAFTEQKLAVQVFSVSAEQKDRSLVALITSNTGSLDSTKNVISVVSAALNSVNCTSAPNCTTLSRISCVKTSGQCGVCAAGYIGDAGDRNTPCILAREVARTTNISVTCSVRTDCPFTWQQCDPSSGLCVAPDKNCSQSCSGHGDCIFVNRNSGLLQSICRLDNLNCDAVCSCVNPFSGEFCEISANALQSRREVRSVLLGSLHNLTSEDDVNPQSVAGWSASLYSLSIQPFELSVNDVQTVTRIANITLQRALQLQVDSYADMAGVLQATDTVASLLRYNYNPNDYDATDFNVTRDYVNNTAAAILHTVSSFGELISGSMVLGQNATTILYNNFRMSVALNTVHAGVRNITLSNPQTESETVSNRIPSAVSLVPSVTFDSSTTVALKMISVYPRAYAPDTSDYISTPLLLQVQAQDGNSTTAGAYLSSLEFSFQNNDPQHRLVDVYEKNFTTVCDAVASDEYFTYACPDSGVMLRHNCSQIGTQTSYCPKPAPACAQVDVANGDLRYPLQCEVVHFNVTFTTCRCTFSNNARRLRSVDTVEQQILDATGVTDMVASTIYIASDFANTFTAARSFTSPSDAAQVIVVIIMLGFIWVPGLLMLGVNSYVEVKKASAEKRPKTGTDRLVEARQAVLNYVNSVIPNIFTEQASTLTLMMSEVIEHHALFQLFSSQNESKRRENICKSLTLFTFMLFLVAAFFDVSTPQDDGSCKDYLSIESCLKRVSPFDSSQTYCTWDDSPALSQPMCTYRTQNITTQALFYLTVLTTILTAIATIPLDYCFGIISAPTAKSLEGSKMMHTLGAVIGGIRRLSGVGVHRTAPADSAPTHTLVGVGVNRRKRRDKDLVLASRDIPEEFTAASSAARESMSLLTANAHAQQVQQLSTSHKLKRRSQQLAATRSSSSSLQQASSSSRRAETRPAELTVTQIQTQHLNEFLAEVIQQRVLMNDLAEETVEFDRQWGIQKSTESEYVISAEAREYITEAVFSAEEEAHKISKELPNYSVHHAGLEVLHLFMIDLLGHTTPAAKVYEEKFGEEFEHASVVVMWQKYLAVGTLVGLNGFFVYYMILKAFQKGLDWQFQFLVCSIVQFAVELLIFETSECVWLNYSVPVFVRDEVVVAATKLRTLAERIASHPEEFNRLLGGQKSGYFLNAAAELFVSVRVAKALPSLLESKIIGSYTSHLPGVISRTWPHCSSVLEGEKEVPGHHPHRYVLLPRAVTTGLVLALQSFITIPYIYQKVIIRFVQPMVFSGVTIVWFLAVKTIVSAIVVGVLCALLLGYLFWRRYRAQQDARLSELVVIPDTYQTQHAIKIPTFVELHADSNQRVEDEQSDTDSDDSSSASEGDRLRCASDTPLHLEKSPSLNKFQFSERAPSFASSGVLSHLPVEKASYLASSSSELCEESDEESSDGFDEDSAVVSVVSDEPVEEKSTFEGANDNDDDPDDELIFGFPSAESCDNADAAPSDLTVGHNDNERDETRSSYSATHSAQYSHNVRLALHIAPSATSDSALSEEGSSYFDSISELDESFDV